MVIALLDHNIKGGFKFQFHNVERGQDYRIRAHPIPRHTGQNSVLKSSASLCRVSPVPPQRGQASAGLTTDTLPRPSQAEHFTIGTFHISLQDAHATVSIGIAMIVPCVKALWPTLVTDEGSKGSRQKYISNAKAKRGRDHLMTQPYDVETFLL